MARRLGVTQGWLRALAEAGKVPALRAGRRYLFSATVVAGALAAMASRSAADDRQEVPDDE